MNLWNDEIPVIYISHNTIPQATITAHYVCDFSTKWETIYKYTSIYVYGDKQTHQNKNKQHHPSQSNNMAQLYINKSPFVNFVVVCFCL
jgi:hypothetical protein